MFGNTQTVETHGIRCFGVGHGGFAHQIAVHAGYFFGFVQIQFQHLFAELIVAFGAVLDEILVFQPFAHDVIQHHVQQRHIGSRAKLKVVFGVAGQLGSAGINHDGRHFHGKLLEFGAGNGVAFGGVGPDDHDEVGVF